MNSDIPETPNARKKSPPAAAAETAGDIPAGAFVPGMTVVHPRYGLGTVTAVSGEGVKRRATVAFAANGETLTFILAFCPLRPAEPA